jgi:hypothetical protein
VAVTANGVNAVGLGEEDCEGVQAAAPRSTIKPRAMKVLGREAFGMSMFVVIQSMLALLHIETHFLFERIR